MKYREWTDRMCVSLYPGPTLATKYLVWSVAQPAMLRQFRVVLPHENPSEAKYVYAPSKPPAAISAPWCASSHNAMNTPSAAPPRTVTLPSGRSSRAQSLSYAPESASSEQHATAGGEPT